MIEVPAGFWIRVVANVIDSIIMGVFGVAVLLIAQSAGADAVSQNWISLCTNILAIIIVITLWVKWKGKTPGKALMGIRVVSMDGKDITPGQGVLRQLGYALSTLTLFIGYIMVGLRKDKRGLHDLIAGTKVVYQGSTCIEDGSVRNTNKDKAGEEPD